MPRLTQMTVPHIFLLGAASTASALASAIEEAGLRSGCAIRVSICSGPPGTALPTGDGSIYLMGVDGIPQMDVNDQTHEQAAMQAIRQHLQMADLPYQVLYGSKDDRLAQVMQSLRAPDSLELPVPARAKRTWTWSCDKCSDPQCEHRLLSDLLASRERQDRV